MELRGLKAGKGPGSQDCRRNVEVERLRGNERCPHPGPPSSKIRSFIQKRGVPL